MSNDDASVERTRERRRGWFQFSLRTALWMMVVLAVAFGWLGDRAKLQQQLAAERAEKEGLRAARDYSDSFPDIYPDLLLSSGGLSTVTGAWQASPSNAEADEATVDHFKEFLAGEPFVLTLSGSYPWGYLNNLTTLRGGGTILWDGSGVLRSSVLTTRIDPGGDQGVRVVQDVAPHDAASVSELIKRLADKEATIRARAACTLARLGPQAKDAVPALLDCLKDADAAVRFHAAYALGRTRENSPAVVAALQGALNDDGSGIAAFAGQMLHGIDPTIDVVPRLIELLSHEDAEARRRAVAALIVIHSRQSAAAPAASSAAAAEAVPGLKRLVTDPDWETRKQAMLAVARVASPADAHAILGEVVKAGPGGDKESWTFASLLWNRLDRLVRAAQTAEEAGK